MCYRDSNQVRLPPPTPMRIPLKSAVAAAALSIAAAAMAQERGFHDLSMKEPAKHGHHYVVAIGIDNYQNWPVLGTAESDATGFAQLLTSKLGFEYVTDPLAEKSATRDHINSLIDDELRGKLKPEDDLVIFFAGHGTTRSDKIGSQTEAVGFLVPVEARAPGTDEHWSDYIQIEDLLRRISTLPSEHILVILDSCQSGVALGAKFTRTRADTRFVQDMLRKVSRKVITSAQADQLAADTGPMAKHSLFTGLLMQGLETGKADRFGQGFITGTQLGAYTQHEVGMHEGSRQTPIFGSFDFDDGGELIIPLGAGTAKEGKAGLTQLESDEVAKVKKIGRTYWDDDEPSRNFPAARTAVLKLCESGEAWGCWQAAESFGSGRGGGKEFMRAVTLARQGCQANLTDSCVTLGELFQRGEMIAPDPASAVRIYQDACTQGNVHGCAGLAVLYDPAEGEPGDDVKAQTFARKACDLGALDSCDRLARLEEKMGDYSRSIPIFKKLCDGGFLGGCVELGWRYEEGNGVKRDLVEAARLMRKACDGGESGGCTDLGDFYRKGQYAPKDVVRAAELYRKACDQEWENGCSSLGEMYESGEGVERDPLKAVELYRGSCQETGGKSGCANLGRMYESGTGVPVDLLRAATLYSKACDSWNRAGCTYLGILYETGKGLSKDMEKARSLYEKGCDGVYEIGCERLKALPPK
jgi:TPR repeat protein